MEKLVYSPKEVSELLNVSVSTVYEMINQKVIPSVRIGRKHIIPKHTFENWLINAAGAKA